MKCLIVLAIALVLIVAANEEGKPNQSDIQNESAEKSRISSEQRAENAVDKEVHDYPPYIFGQSEMITEGNIFKVDLLVAKLTAAHVDEGKARDLAAKCIDRNEQGSTPAEWSNRVIQCLSDNKIMELLSEARRKFRQNKQNEN